MISVADVYDVNIPPTENEAYLARIREVLGPWQAELGEQMEAIAKGVADDGTTVTAKDNSFAQAANDQFCTICCKKLNSAPLMLNRFQ